MRVSALTRKLWRDLWHLKGQVFAIAAVVACGIAAFVTMRSTIDSLETSRDMYYSRYRFADIFANLKSAPKDLQEQLRTVPGVMQVETRIVNEVTLDIPGLDEPATGKLISIPETRRAMLNDLSLQRGRWIEPGHADEVIISETFANANQLQIG